MALRTYGKQTLNDNWTEERAPALKGVIADYGNLEYGTTFGSDFSREPKQRAVWQSGQAARRKQYGSGMISNKTIQRHQQDHGKAGMFSGLDVNEHKDRFYDETTNGQGFGGRQKETLVEKKLRKGRFARKAGVNPRNPATREAGSELTGERMLNGEDPANNTAAQRSWMYSADSMFQALDILENNKAKPAKEECFATLPITDGEMPKPKGRTQDVHAPGMNIWSDRLVMGRGVGEGAFRNKQ